MCENDFKDDFKDSGLSNWQERLLYYRHGTLGGRLDLWEFPAALLLALFSSTLLFSPFFLEYMRPASMSEPFILSSLGLEGSWLRYPVGSLSQVPQNSVQMSRSQRGGPRLCLKPPPLAFCYHLLLALAISFPYLFVKSVKWFSMNTNHIFYLLNIV